jgi:hypothetical protein
MRTILFVVAASARVAGATTGALGRTKSILIRAAALIF